MLVAAELRGDLLLVDALDAAATLGGDVWATVTNAFLQASATASGSGTKWLRE